MFIVLQQCLLTSDRRKYLSEFTAKRQQYALRTKDECFKRSPTVSRPTLQAPEKVQVVRAEFLVDRKDGRGRPVDGCPFLTGAQARPALLRPAPFLFPFEAVHCMRLMHWPKSCHSPLPYVSCSLPQAPFPPLRFISVHGVHLHHVHH